VLRLALVILGLAVATPAWADAGAWFWYEHRVPIRRRDPRISFRFISDSRFLADFGGLYQQYLRTGPVYEPTSWLQLAVNGTIYGDLQPDRTTWEWEARLEIEPTFQVRFGRVQIQDRNRLEYRFRETRDERVRYRNLVRVNVDAHKNLMPFVWNEWFIDLRDAWNENRFVAGLGIRLAPHVRFDLGYMLRTRAPVGQTAHDHIALISIFVGVAPRSDRR
jgi:hypothetical protein